MGIAAVPGGGYCAEVKVGTEHLRLFAEVYSLGFLAAVSVLPRPAASLDWLFPEADRLHLVIQLPGGSPQYSFEAV